MLPQPETAAIATSVHEPTEADQRAAEQFAARWGFRCVARADKSLAALAREHGVEAIFIVSTRALALFAGDKPHRFHGGMGALRVKRRRIGELETVDGLLAAAELREGESVLDCTVGLGQDALVAASAIGQGGKVVGIEGSRILGAFVADGLAALTREHATAPIEIRVGDHLAVMKSLADASFDVVLFDPMFRQPLQQAPTFDLVRKFADARPLTLEALAEARRVARRAVIVKDASPGHDLIRLGLKPLPSRRGAPRVYARDQRK